METILFSGTCTNLIAWQPADDRSIALDGTGSDFKVNCILGFGQPGRKAGHNLAEGRPTIERTAGHNVSDSTACKLKHALAPRAAAGTFSFHATSLPTN